MIPSIGQSVPRREGDEKLRGTARYLDDLPTAGVWFGGTIRSSVAHGRLVGIERDPAFPWDRVVFVTAADIPGKNVIRLIEDDQPALAGPVIRHVEEPVALIAAPDRELLSRARAAVRVIEEPRDAVLDPVEALAAGGRVFKHIEIHKADEPSLLSRALLLVEGEYSFGSQEHVYIEPQAMQARWTDDGVVIEGSLQCPYYVVKGLAELLAVPPPSIRVIQTTTGGGFGGKEEYPTMIAAHAALLARAARRPVRIVYDRTEDMLATTKRHPGRVRHRTGVTEAGRIVTMEIDVLLDGGAYCTLSPVVLSRAAIHAAGPYDCQNVRIVARAVATNRPPFGAFRGFGAPQTLFALEAHVDECARRVGMDPVEFRRRNLLRPGGHLATGQLVGTDGAAGDVLEEAIGRSDWEARRAAARAFNETGGATRRGVGLALFHHGSGFTGSGEAVLGSKAGLRANADGSVTVLSAQTEMGQGTRTILAQAAADGLGIHVDRVRTEDPDTSVMPNSGPTVASRTGMIVGGLLVRAGRELRARFERAAGRALPGDELCRAMGAAAAEGTVEHVVTYEPPADMHWDDEKYRGDAYAAYSWACYVAEVEVDVLTGETRVTDFTAVQEVGRVMNPILARGQIEGGVVQGIGWALLEHVAWDDHGRMKNPTMTDYIVPTAMDVPALRVHFVERPTERAPHGAKGIGELPMDGPAPAIVNALHDALGVRFRHLPVLPEDVLEALGALAAADAR